MAYTPKGPFVNDSPPAINAVFLNDLETWIDDHDANHPSGGTSDPLALNGNQVKLVYMTVAVSAVATDGWYFPDKTAPTLTGRVASITWEGTSAQIPAQGTADAQFKTGDTAMIRSTSL